MYLVDEFRTSCRCSACGGEWKTFRVCESDSPRPYRTGRILSHGLVRCNTCSTMWNRDTNAASNIWKKVEDCHERDSRRSATGKRSPHTSQKRKQRKQRKRLTQWSLRRRPNHDLRPPHPPKTEI